MPILSAAGYLDADLARRRAAVPAIDHTETWDWLERTAPSVDRHHDVGRTTALFDVAHVIASTRAERWALRLLRRRLVAWHLDA